MFSAGPAPVEGLLRQSSPLELVILPGWNTMSLVIRSVAKSTLFPYVAFKAYRGNSIHSGVFNILLLMLYFVQVDASAGLHYYGIPAVIWRGCTGNLLFAARTTGREEEEFRAHAVHSHD